MLGLCFSDAKLKVWMHIIIILAAVSGVLVATGVCVPYKHTNNPYKHTNIPAEIHNIIQTIQFLTHHPSY